MAVDRAMASIGIWAQDTIASSCISWTTKLMLMAGRLIAVKRSHFVSVFSNCMASSDWPFSAYSSAAAMPMRIMLE